MSSSTRAGATGKRRASRTADEQRDAEDDDHLQTEHGYIFADRRAAVGACIATTRARSGGAVAFRLEIVDAGLERGADHLQALLGRGEVGGPVETVVAQRLAGLLTLLLDGVDLRLELGGALVEAAAPAAQRGDDGAAGRAGSPGGRGGRTR